MNYLVEGAITKVGEEIGLLENAVYSLKKLGFQDDSVAIRVLTDKLTTLRYELRDLEAIVQ